MSDNWSFREFVIGRKSSCDGHIEYVSSYNFDTFEIVGMTEVFTDAIGFEFPYDAGRAMAKMAANDNDYSWFVFSRVIVREKIIGMEVRGNETNC